MIVSTPKVEKILATQIAPMQITDQRTGKPYWVSASCRPPDNYDLRHQVRKLTGVDLGDGARMLVLRQFAPVLVHANDRLVNHDDRVPKSYKMTNVR